MHDSLALRQPLHGRRNTADMRSRTFGVHAADALLGVHRLQIAHVFQWFDHTQIHRGPAAGIHDGNRSAACQKTCGFFGRIDRGGQPDTLQKRFITGIIRNLGFAVIAVHRVASARFGDQVFQPFKAQCQMRTTLGTGHRMNLIDDYRVDGAENPPGLGSEQQIERFGRGDKDVRRMGGDAPTLLSSGVAGPVGNRDFRRGQPLRLTLRSDTLQRLFEVFGHVDCERLQWRNIQHTHARTPRTRHGHQPVNGGKKRGQCFTGASRSDDQYVPSGMDRRPCLSLCLGRLTEGMFEPRFGRFRKQTQAFAHMFDCSDAGKHREDSGWESIARRRGLRISPSPASREPLVRNQSYHRGEPIWSQLKYAMTSSAVP